MSLTRQQGIRSAISTSVGRKVIMAVTGMFMILFVIVHMLGNLTIFAGYIDVYAAKLHSMFLLIWGYRVVLAAAVIVHFFFGIQLTFENRAAKPQENALTRYRDVTFAGETMIWSGLLLAGFITYHLLHFTARVTNPAISHFVNAAGFPDVYRMVVLSFQNGIIAPIYVASMVVLFLHLSHGIQSLVQTLGWNSDRTLPAMRATGLVISAILLIGFAAIPLTVIVGILRD